MIAERDFFSKSAFLTAGQAARLLNVSLSTLKKLIYQNKLRTYRTPGGHHRILSSDLLGSFTYPCATRLEDQWSVNRANSLDSLVAMMAMIENRYKYAQGHAAVVCAISREIAQLLRFSSVLVERIAIAALLHDVGMLAIDESIINKRRPLTSRECSIVRTHPSVGARMVENFPAFVEVGSVIEQHHEKMDGTGYPKGLKGRQISQEARIVAFAECLDRMTAPDSYSQVLSFEQATDAIANDSGRCYAPEVVDVFLRHRENIVRVINNEDRSRGIVRR